MSEQKCVCFIKYEAGHREDCPMHAKAESAPREFWIEEVVDINGEFWPEYKVLDKNPYPTIRPDDYTHVIEYAAYAKAIEERDTLKSELNELKINLNQEIAFLDAYKDHFKKLLADRNERDELKDRLKGEQLGSAIISASREKLKAECAKLKTEIEQLKHVIENDRKLFDDLNWKYLELKKEREK